MVADDVEGGGRDQWQMASKNLFPPLHPPRHSTPMIGKEIIQSGRNLGIKTLYARGNLSEGLWRRAVVAYFNSGLPCWDECWRLVVEFTQCRLTPSIWPIDSKRAILFMNSEEDADLLGLVEQKV